MKKAYGDHVLEKDSAASGGDVQGTQSDGKSEESELTDCSACSFCSLQLSLKDYPL